MTGLTDRDDGYEFRRWEMYLSKVLEQQQDSGIDARPPDQYIHIQVFSFYSIDYCGDFILYLWNCVTMLLITGIANSESNEKRNIN